jgi:hypothetical protein
VAVVVVVVQVTTSWERCRGEDVADLQLRWARTSENYDAEQN